MHRKIILLCLSASLLPSTSAFAETLDGTWIFDAKATEDLVVGSPQYHGANNIGAPFEGAGHWFYSRMYEFNGDTVTLRGVCEADKEKGVEFRLLSRRGTELKYIEKENNKNKEELRREILTVSILNDENIKIIQGDVGLMDFFRWKRITNDPKLSQTCTFDALLKSWWPSIETIQKVLNKESKLNKDSISQSDQQEDKVFQECCKIAGEKVYRKPGGKVTGIFFTDGMAMGSKSSTNTRYNIYYNGINNGLFTSGNRYYMPDVNKQLLQKGLIAFYEIPTPAEKEKPYKRFYADDNIGKEVDVIKSEYTLTTESLNIPCVVFNNSDFVARRVILIENKSKSVIAETTYIAQHRGRRRFCGHSVAGQFSTEDFITRALNLSPSSESSEKNGQQLETTFAIAEVTPSTEKLSVVSGKIETGNDQPTGKSVVRSVHSRRIGKYYFEMIVEQAGVPKNINTDIVARVSNTQRWVGISYRLSSKDLVLRLGDQSSITIVGGDLGKDLRIPKIVIGIAVDLNESRLYYHRNGVWQNNAPPGSPEGVALNQNAEYIAEVSAMSELLPLLEKGMVKVNFGGTPFENHPPAGYQGFDEKVIKGNLRTPLFPGVYSPNDQIISNSQVYWIQRYWEWVRSFTQGESPSSDITGYRCGTGQSGPVWFLTGSRDSAPIRRECRVPEGKIVLVPIINVLAQSRSAEQAGCDKMQLSLKAFNKADNLRLKVNGTIIEKLENNFIGTGCFSLRDGASGVLGSAFGTGYWIFTKPLKRGRYEIEFGGRYPADNYAQDIGYVLYVE